MTKNDNIPQLVAVAHSFLVSFGAAEAARALRKTASKKGVSVTEVCALMHPFASRLGADLCPAVQNSITTPSLADLYKSFIERENVQ
ncbi:hypothetical protein HDU82_000322, partial [Entophlyctis luteolus]